jgi:hypothetical protein
LPFPNVKHQPANPNPRVFISSFNEINHAGIIITFLPPQRYPVAVSINTLALSFYTLMSLLTKAERGCAALPKELYVVTLIGGGLLSVRF